MNAGNCRATSTATMQSQASRLRSFLGPLPSRSECHILAAMRQSIISFLLVSSLAAASMAQRPSADRPQAIAITHVTLINPNTASAKRDMTVIIRGDRIVVVRPSRIAHIQKGTTTVDASGKFLIPGLWDMHVHLGTDDFDQKQVLRLFITQGVTGIRIMSGMPRHHFWREEIERGSLLGPRLLIASRAIAGRSSFAGNAIKVNDAEEARAAVKIAQKEKADFIKVHDGLSREAYFAIIDESRRLSLKVAGHVPDSITAAEASNAGQISIEHFTGLSDAEIDPTKADALIAILKKNHTAVCPTLIMRRNYSVLDDRKLVEDPRLRYLDKSWKGWWLNMVSSADKSPASEWAGRRETVQREKLLVAKFHRAGLQILAGTDTSNPFVMPGFALHDELAILVESGLSPMEALRSATINPAEFVKKTATLGSVQTGHAADLVILDANPLADIHNTTKISAVIVRGRLFDRTALDKILKEIETAAAKD